MYESSTGNKPLHFVTASMMSACAMREVTVVAMDSDLPLVEPGQTITLPDAVTGRHRGPASLAIARLVPLPR